MVATPGIPPLGLKTKLFFGIGSLAEGTKTVAYSAYLLIFYNQVIGLAPQTVTLVLMIVMERLTGISKRIR